MANRSGSSSRILISKGKDVMHGDNTFLDTETYNDFIQRQSYVDKTHLHPPPPPIPNPFLSIQWKANLKIYPIMILLILKFPMMKTLKRRKQFDLSEVHMKKVENTNRTKIVVCIFCSKEFKWSKSEVYDTYLIYVNSLHPTETVRSKSRGQIQIVRYVSPNIQLFRYFYANN